MLNEIRDLWREGGPNFWRDAARDLAGALAVAGLLIAGLYLPAAF